MNKEETLEQEIKEQPKKEKKKKVDQEKEKLKLDNQQLNDKVLRLSAEMQNMKKRYDEQIAQIYRYDGEELVKQLLPVIDNFERAIKIDDSNINDEMRKFLEGFKMIYANFLNLLKDKGITEIECLGKQFDPNFMEAVLTENIIEEEQNVVLDVLQKGYMYNEKVIRPAMVKVNE